ncbi:MAG TPA: protein kinase [Gemmatimonadaceae bacterium]|nr:protein kinase [Gemmatimonadaceae bacterium]
MAELHERLGAALGDRYRIEHELGRGGMGVVFLAHDPKHDRRVALKVLRPEVANTTGAERFLREIRIAAKLQHPNILPLIDSGEADGLTYYVMPYVPGESLRDRLEREHELPLDDVIRIAREIAGALTYAHSQGFIHRDIKPENILLGGGHALLADFGVAHILLTAGEKLTETGIAVGTPAYMSPEQGAGGGGFDHRSDIYSLGCVVYEMLTGTPPFTGSYQVVLARKAVEPVPGIRVVRDTVPPHVEQAVMTAMAKVAADRFATAAQFADALAGSGHVVRTSAALRASRKRWMLAGAAAAVVMIAGTYVLIAGVPFSSGAPEMAGARHTLLTSDPGIEWFPSLSADGRWVVYAGEQSGNRDIYLQSVTGQMPINLTADSPDDDDQPAFSPDGERIAFRSSRDGGGIFVMGRTGESLRRVTNGGYRPTWSPDGEQIAFVTENVEMNPGNSEGQSELWVVNADGGGARRLPTGDATLPAWSPGGHRIAYYRRLGAPAQGDIWTIGRDGGEAVRLTTEAERDWSPAWSPDGRYVYFSSNRGGSMNLWRIPADERTGRARGAAEPLTTPATFLAHPTIAGDGSRIAYVSAQVTINIQRLAFDPVAAAVAGDPAPVTTGARQFSSPDPSPDGEWAAYYTLTQPEGDIYLSRVDGSQRRQLTDDAGADRIPRWSPDGQWVSFFSNRGGHLQIWKIRPDGSGLQRLTTRLSAYHAWSPDGRRIAAASASAADTVIVLDAFGAEDQEPEILPTSTIGHFFVNSWSADGELLAGQIGTPGGMGRGIAIYSFRSRRYERLTDFGEWPVFLPDGRRILFVANRNAFHVVDSRTGEVRQVWSVERDIIGPPRLSADGRWAYFSRRVTEADIWMLTLPSAR